MNVPIVEWTEARLLVFADIARIDEETKKLFVLVGKAEDKLEGKFAKDIHEAHEKIRVLQMGQRRLEREIWRDRAKSAAIASSVTMLLFVVIKVVWPILLNVLTRVGHP